MHSLLRWRDRLRDGTINVSEVLVLKTLRLFAITASFAALIFVGCGDDAKETGTGLPPRGGGGTNDGGQTNTGSSSGSTNTDSGYDCSNHEPVDKNPACDQCARSKCCEWIVKCDGAPSCKATMDCLGQCANDDTVCILSCGSGGGAGGTFLSEFGACLNNQCKSECASSQPDASFDSNF